MEAKMSAILNETERTVEVRGREIKVAALITAIFSIGHGFALFQGYISFYSWFLILPLFSAAVLFTLVFDEAYYSSKELNENLHKVENLNFDSGSCICLKPCDHFICEAHKYAIIKEFTPDCEFVLIEYLETKEFKELPLNELLHDYVKIDKATHQSIVA